jgi:hypothetical protein
MIAGIAALRLRVGQRLALEIGAGDIVEQHFIAQREQFPATLRQMRFQRRLVHQQMIEAAIEAILGNVQLARRLAEARDHQHNRHLRPGNAFLPDRQQALAQLLKPDAAPQRQRQIHITELPRTLDADALQTNRHRQMVAAVVEKLRALRRAD